MICDHKVDASFCGVCRFLPRPGEAPQLIGKFQALHDYGICSCGEPITAGQFVKKLTGGWILHGNCQPRQ